MERRASPGDSLFLSYHRSDLASVRLVRIRLQELGFRTFLDQNDLPVGLPWPRALEQALRKSSAVAVFIGPGGLGRWQQKEMYLALELQTEWEEEDRSFPVIPVLLPGADPPPGFLILNTWIDLRHDFPALESFDGLVRSILRAPPGEASPAAGVAALDLCPYRGLRAFREEDAPFYFGREAFIDCLLEKVRGGGPGPHLVAVVGPSGSGKSSVVMAGLLPHLRKQRPMQSTWEAVRFSPGEHPWRRLSDCLIPLLEPDLSEAERIAEAGILADALQGGPEALASTAKRVLEKSGGTDRFLIVVDQFEDLFTLSPEQEVQPLVRSLLAACSSPQVAVLLTLRSDFYGPAIACDRELSDALDAGLVNLGPLRVEELRRVITEPAKQVGLTFEPGLTDLILEDVQAEPGGLPLLEFALTELWVGRQGRVLTVEQYIASGRVGTAIATRAESVFSSLSADQKQAARRLFTRLVRVAETDGEGKDTCRSAKRSEIGPIAWVLVAAFSGEGVRLLVTSRDTVTAEETVEVAHEALLRSWSRLRSWLAEDRSFLLWRQQLAIHIDHWERSEYDSEHLLIGSLLAEAVRWISYLQEAHGSGLNSEDWQEILGGAEKEFLNASMEADEEAQQAREARLRRIARMIAATALGLFLLLMATLIGWQRAAREKEHAVAAQNVARARELAALAWEFMPEEPEKGLLLSVEASERSDDTEVTANLLRALAETADIEAFLRGPELYITAVQFADDEKQITLANTSGRLFSWDREQHRLTSSGCLCDSAETVNRITAIGAGGRYFAVSGDQNNAWLRRDTDVRLTNLEGFPAPVSALAFSPRGRLLAVGLENGIVNLIDVSAMQQIGHSGMSYTAAVSSLALSYDESLVALGFADGVVGVFGTSFPFTQRMGFKYHSGAVQALAFSRDGRLLATGGLDKRVSLWKVSNSIGPKRGWWEEHQLGELLDHKGGINALAFSPDGGTLASASLDGQIILWDVATRLPAGKPLRAHSGSVSSLAFNRTGTILASGGWDGRIILWRVPRRFPAGIPVLTKYRSYGSVYRPTGTYKEILAWNVRDGRALGPFRGGDWVRTLRFQPGNRPLEKPTRDEYLTFQAIASDLPEVFSWAGPPTFFVWNVSLDDGGKVMLAGGWNLSLWDVRSHRRLGAPLHNQSVTSSRISSDGKMAAAVSGGNLMLWDLGSRVGRSLIVKSGDFAGDTLTFSSDGKWLVTNTRDGRLLIRATDHDKEFLSEKIHEAPVSSIIFSPNGRLLASASIDGRVAIWSRESNRLVFGPYKAYDSGFVSLSFDRSGSRLVTVLWDMREIAYTESIESPKVRACRMVGRSFTRHEWAKLFENEPYHDTCSKYRLATADLIGIEVLFRAEGNLDRSTRWPSEPRVDSFRLQNQTGKKSGISIYNEKGRLLVLPKE